MITLLTKILLPIFGMVFKFIDDRNAAKKRYVELVKKYQREININYTQEEKEAFDELQKRD